MSLRKLHRGAIAAGGYTPHQFLIHLAKEFPFVSTPGRNPTREYFHIFTHEFWHYWHNFSTFSGVKQFIVSQHLLALFSRTLMAKADGTSVGAEALGDDQYTVAALLAVHDNVEGQVAPVRAWLEDGNVTFRVTSAQIEDGNIAFGDGHVPGDVARLQVEVTFGDGAVGNATMILGTAAIEESIAFLVEEHVADRTPVAVRGAAPWFPYRLLQETLAYLVGRPLPPLHAAAVGTLALLTTHPGPALIELGRRYRQALQHAGSVAQRPPQESLDDIALSAVVSLTNETHADRLQRLEGELASIAEMHRGRGLLERAATYCLEQSRRALQLRRVDPLFDLRAVFVDRPVGALIRFQEQFASCDVLQERYGGDDVVLRDDLVRIGEEEPDEEGFVPSTYARTFQAQQSFVYAHVDHENGTFVSTLEARSPCPYYTACGLPLRRTNSETCKSRPWAAFDPSAPDGCWYAIAVAGSLGPVRVSRPLQGVSGEQHMLHEEIEIAAYYRWLSRGGAAAPDAPLDDWLTAERELMHARRQT